jgi:hypothetical protein
MKKAIRTRPPRGANASPSTKTLAQRFPHVLRFEQIGTSDGGIPVHAGVVSADGA